jgi:ubiquinone/menaquinone biosynthesis C-methylase UbiE
LDNKYTLKQHNEFGFLQIDPLPSDDEITEFYAKEFYSGEYSKFNDSSLEVQLENRAFYEGNWSDMAFHIETILQRPIKETTLLDVGCGWAQALLYFSDLGSECYGFDPAPEAIEYGLNKGLKLKHAGMDKMNVFEGTRFDVVMLNNVLEHLSNPVDVLKEIKEDVLKPDGLIIIDVPNEFNAFQKAGQELFNLEEWWVAPPGHLNYFSKDTLTNLLEGVGYSVKVAESSFPLEMFLLFGECYVGNPEKGKHCHEQRVAFECNLRKLGYGDKLREFYQALAEINIGRQIIIYATAT